MSETQQMNFDVPSAVESLSGPSRRERQMASTFLAEQAKADPESVLPYGESIVDSLNRPEAHTRWESLEALAVLVKLDPQLCDTALHGAESALFDEDSGMVRLAAMRFLCAIGSVSPGRSLLVWPLIDEAIQCYHGDLEFHDMLKAVVDFSSGNLADEVKAGLVSRMSFDAENSKGTLARRARTIIENTGRG